MITLTGQLAPDDYLAATNLHMRKRGWKRLAWILVWSVLGVAAFMFGLIALREPSSGLPNLSVILLIFIAYLFVRTVYLPRRVRRIFSQQKNLQLPFESTVTDSGIDSTNANGKTHLPWSHVIRWKEGATVFIVYQSDLMFCIVPKRLFTHPEHLDAFRALLTEQVGAAA